MIACPCSFLLANETGDELTKGEAEIKLDIENLMILPKFGEAIHLSLMDITEILPAEYRVNMILSSRESLLFLTWDINSEILFLISFK